MSRRRILLIGATGLVGRAVMQRAVGLDSVHLAAISRRRVALPEGARMEMFVADTDHWADIIESIQPDCVVCALGTTWDKSGQDEAAFRAVDEKLVLEVAKATKAAGVRQFICVSAIGADRSSRHLYMRVKAEVEDALLKLRLPRLDILRPGLLRGERVDDPRPREKWAMRLSPLLDLLVLHGSWRRFRSMSGTRMAEVIFDLAQEKAGGRFVHEYDSMMRAARRFERAQEEGDDGIDYTDSRKKRGQKRKLA
jgi:uncharacterized protein YbjT (DUF2867 family)